MLKTATEECMTPDIRDRGYFYWRLLSTNPEVAKAIVLGDRPAIRDDTLNMDQALLETLLKEVACMSSVYHMRAEDFVTRVRLVEQKFDEQIIFFVKFQKLPNLTIQIILKFQNLDRNSLKLHRINQKNCILGRR